MSIIDGEFPEVDEEEPAAPPRAELRDQRFQLSGDARLQFWREAYLTALQACITGELSGERYPPQGWQRELVKVASEIADHSLAAHLTRNDVQFPDAAVDLWERIRKGE